MGGMRIGNNIFLDKFSFRSNLLIFLTVFIGLTIIFSYGVGNASAASGDTIYVNGADGNDNWDGQSSTWNGSSGPKSSIGNAASKVNNNGIIRIANGIYTGSANGDLNILNNMTIVGQSRNGTIINYHFISSLTNGFSVTIANLTISNGIYGDGGAIRKSGGDLTLNNINFEKNKAAESGGAISNYNGNLTVNNCTFTDNSGGQLGPGGIDNWGNLTVYLSTFSGNDAVIYNHGNATITSSTFTANTASTGGIINNYDTLSINYSRIYGNIGGKAVFNDVYEYPHANANLMFNWWGTNDGPRSVVDGTPVYEWLMLRISVNPSTIPTIGHATVTADLLHDNYGGLVTGMIPDGNSIKFLTDLGKLTNTSSMINMVAVSNFSSISTGIANINATMDNQTVFTTLKIVTLTAKASLASGVYKVNELVALSMTEDGNIYYTLNGTTPTTASTKYTGKITISSSKVLKLFAVDNAGNKSPIYTYTYTIDKTPPKVTLTSPTNLKTGVARSSNVVIKFSENIKNSTYYSSITIKNASTGKNLGLSKSMSKNILTIKTSTKTANTWYIVTIPKSAMKDMASNNSLATYTFKFKTGN
jgi:predicted outer membrane repeat protein